jgi:type II secretory pathway pseudopilin PulG
MSVSKPHSFQSGFSLVELLVALVFTAILTTGMLRIFASSVSGFYTQQESLGLQRASRFALGAVEDEILQAGYLFPPRNLHGELKIGSSAVQPPVLVQQTDYQPVWSDPNGTTVTLPNVDELQFVQDLNLEVEGAIATGADVAAGATSASVSIPSGKAALDKYLKDTTNNPLVMVMLDSQINSVDMLRISSLSGSGGTYTAALDTASTGVDTFGNVLGGGFFTGMFNNPHKAKAPCAFIATLQVVRYTVVPRALDPADPKHMIPCLVLQTAPLDRDAYFAPDKDSGPAASANWTERILVEGVTGFKVDLSLDGGKTFLRYNPDGTLKAGMDSWANVYTALDTKVKEALSASSLLYTYTSLGLSNPIDPVWTNYLPVTFRLDVETRTRLARAEYRNDQTAPPAFRTRTVTMMISPKNFALGSSQ